MRDKLLFFDEDCNLLLRRLSPDRIKEDAIKWFEFLYSTNIDAVNYTALTNELSWIKDITSAEIAGARYRYFDNPELWIQKENLKILFEKNVDILYLASETARKYGKKIFAQVNMCDIRHEEREGILGCEFYCPQVIFDHPEWRIVCGHEGYKRWLLDFSHQEVRNIRLKIIHELAEKYDVDGIVFSWLGGSRFFPSERQKERVPLLTEFLKEVRYTLDKAGKNKGHKLLMIHKISPELDENTNIGCDITTWVKKGLADAVQPMDSLYTDFNIRTERYAVLCKDYDCGVYPGVYNMLLGGNSDYLWHYGMGEMDEEKYRAVTANFLAWGANGIVLNIRHNWIWNQSRVKDKVEKAINAISFHKCEKNKIHCYHYQPTWKWDNSGFTMTGRKNAQRLQFRSDELGKRQVFKFRMADGRDGEKLRGYLRAQISEATFEDEFYLDINGIAIPKDKIKTVSEISDYTVGIGLEIDLADCPPFKGDNELGIRWIKKNWNISKDPYMEILYVYVIE